MIIMKKSQPKNGVNMSSDFEPSALDEKFRENVHDLLEKAEKEVIIITGEGGSYQYQDLHWALERVSEKGIPIRIYCVHPPRTYINKNLQLASEIYRGDEDPDEHYLIVDRKHTVTSAARAGKDVGARKGETRNNDKEFAEEKINLFHSLASEAEEVTEIEVEEDPLWKLIQNPIDFGYDTHSEKFEEEL